MPDFDNFYFVFAYLVGAIPFGLILTKLAGYGDIRKLGSGNIGATNVLRTGNKPLALLTLVLDAAKGAYLILLAYYLADYWPGFFGTSLSTSQESDPLLPSDLSYTISISIGFFAVLGHCFPVWLKFKGGKGVATSLGVLLAAVPLAGFVACCTWGIVAGFFRYSSLAALSAVCIAPIVVLIFYGSMPALIATLIAVVVFLKHRSNMERLVAGTEPKIGERNERADDSPPSE